jgi:hypothetical protein
VGFYSSRDGLYISAQPICKSDYRIDSRFGGVPDPIAEAIAVSALKRISKIGSQEVQPVKRWMSSEQPAQELILLRRSLFRSLADDQCRILRRNPLCTLPVRFGLHAPLCHMMGDHLTASSIAMPADFAIQLG